MPVIREGDIGLALDMHGCPNRCRHCALGIPRGGSMTHDDLRWAARQFREFVKPGEEKPFIKKLAVFSWFYEPDYTDDYEQLCALEAELSDVPPVRFELHSIWRLARDEKYAPWAKKVGPDTCQVSFFGLEETQDWFCRRRGAFRDSILATERLLEAGMKPRWQLFLTKKILPDLAGLMKLVDNMRLRERVRALGNEFQLFIHPPGLTGEGQRLAYLSATLEDTKRVPQELVESTRRHIKTDKIWTTEAEVMSRILSGKETVQPPYSYPPNLCFEVAANWDVFTNMGNGGSYAPCWTLGNLKRDPLSVIMSNFEEDRIIPLQLNRPEILQEAARRYGNSARQDVVNDIEESWYERYCEAEYRRGLR